MPVSFRFPANPGAPRPAHRLLRGILTLAVLLQLATFVHKVWPRGDDAHTAFFSDDLYYYLVVAEHRINEGVSSFDGITITNGYHPLWMWTLQGIIRFTGSANTRFFQIFALLISFCCFLTFRGMLGLADRYFPDQPLGAAAAAFCWRYAFSIMAGTGMEVCLTLPLILAVLAFSRVVERDPRPSRVAFLGLLCALLALSRLDAVFLILLLLLRLAWIWRKSPAVLLGRLAMFGLGGIPLPLYLMSNLLRHGQLLTVSGRAKQLAPGLHWSWRPLRSLIETDGVARLYLAVCLAALTACLLLALCRPRAFRSRAWILVPVGFPFLYYTVLSLLSDWPLWFWYQYPLPIATLLSGLTAMELAGAHRLRSIRLHQAGWLLAAAVPLLGSWQTVQRQTASSRAIYDTAKQLEPFVRSHPGLYAMGDRAGLTAFLLPVRIHQLEGLVADRETLDAITAETNLNDYLAYRGVSYYLSAAALSDAAGVHHAEEPHQGSPRSPRMRGRFPHPPVFEVVSEEKGHAVITRVFVALPPPESSP